MALDLIRIDPERYPLEAMPCLRCGGPAMLRFAGPCERCATELRTNAAALEVRAPGTEYVPKVNVTANAIATKDD